MSGSGPAARDTVKPWLLLDIDGVLNPTDDHADRGFAEHHLHGYRVQLSREHGRMLNDLVREDLVDLRWATTWNHAANAYVAPVVGLADPLPVLVIDRALAGPVPYGVNWKAASVLAEADGMPFAWLDDFLTDADRRWAEARVLDTGIPTLLVPIDPAVGLLPEHLDQVRSWARSTSGPGVLTGEDLLRRTPHLSANPVSRDRADWFARTCNAVPDRAAGLDRRELAVSLWDCCATAVTAEYSGESRGLRPTDEFVRQSFRRFLRGDGAAATVWADRAALRAAQPERGDVTHAKDSYRLVLGDTPDRDAGQRIQLLVDSAVADLGISPDIQRTHRSIQMGPSGPLLQVTVRADRRDTSSDLTVAFGHDGQAERVPYDQLLRDGPDALRERAARVSRSVAALQERRSAAVAYLPRPVARRQQQQPYQPTTAVRPPTSPQPSRGRR
ncbi:HAD domain-containing protein [Micromonospora psammae]|uniref:HAD domain-containing protein n=1 Tax=Micromonospora sp. CPCC 205556 TaxID=3122398 RepID=UPI002FF00297